MDYDLFGLNSRSFEQLVQAIASKVLGPGLVVFGDGSDGGREGSMEGRVPYPTEAENWEGHLVLQAKFRQRTQGTGEDGRWLLNTFRKELKEYETDRDPPRIKPDYLILASNVTLSAVQGSGTKDRLFEMAENSFLRGFDVWDYDKLRVYLDQFEEIRRGFAAFISAGDVLAEAIEVLGELKAEQPDFEDVASRFLQSEFLAERWARLEQAGKVSDEQVSVSRVFVDLPTFERRSVDPPDETAGLLPGFAAQIAEVASTRLDPETLGLRRSPGDRPKRRSDGRFVLLGGPGQGKSTVCQFICQIFRAALLDSRSPASLAPEVDDCLRALKAHLEEDGLELPAARRFPIRIELTKLADALADPEGPDSLLGYVASLVADRVEDCKISAESVGRWLSQYPSLIVLDGLDEVPLTESREAIMAALQDFWIAMAHWNADCLAIATTRPQGYGDEFSPRYYNHVWLAPISTRRALHYSKRLLDARFHADPDRHKKVMGRLELAAEGGETARLMTTPLQVTIMATLLDAIGQPPDGRFKLFSRYYRVVYERELDREIPAASVLRDYEPEIDAIHRHVALLLQVEGESKGQSEPKMSSERFAQVVRERLRSEEQDIEGEDDLVAQIIMAATDRLVFLVGVESDQVGFEIRSLQEFMAAEALLDGPEALVEKRLRAVAGLPRWRNVFLFAAARCFDKKQHLRDTIHTICAELNEPENDPLAPVALPGAELAADLLADGAPNRQPKYERLLARQALRALRLPPGPLSDRLGEVYRPSLRRVYEEELRAGLAQEPFFAALGTWRTLVVILARQEEWALSLLETRWPRPEDLPDVLRALSRSAKSWKLARRLAELCVQSPPEAVLPLWGYLTDLGITEFLPRWFDQILGVVGMGIRRWNTFAVLDAPGLESVDVRPVGSFSGTFQDAGHEEWQRAANSWEPLFRALAFSRAPSVERLADALEQFANVSEDVRQRFGSASWPLGGLLLAAEDEEDLRRYGRLAREGKFGDHGSWLLAEKRWEESGVTAADFSGAVDEGPWDERIAIEGFPIFASELWTAPPYLQAAETVLSWLERVSFPPTRRYLLGRLFWLALPERVREDPQRIPAAAIVRTLREGDHDDLPASALAALNGLQWADPLEKAEVDLLDHLGRRIGQLASRQTGELRPVLREAILAAWNREPQRLGLYQLLALGWPEGEAFGEGCPPGSAAAPPDGGGQAADLLSLKISGKIDAGWQRIVVGGEIWVHAGLDVLLDPDRAASAEEALPRIDALLPTDRWPERQRVGAVAREVVSRRTSGLMGDEPWDRLGLFTRPREEPSELPVVSDD